MNRKFPSIDFASPQFGQLVRPLLEITTIAKNILVML